MIYNLRQYNAAADAVARISEELRTFDAIALARDGVDPIIIEAQRRSLESERGRLAAQLARYDALRSGAVDVLSAVDLSEVGKVLIEARLALGLTQRQLGERLSMKEQQIQRYEQDRYRSANLDRLQSVSEALHLGWTIETKLPADERAEPPYAFNAKLLPIREMKKRGWLEPANSQEGDQSDASLAAIFMRSATGGQHVASLHRQKVRSGGKVDPYAISAWKARILQRARSLRFRSIGRPNLDAPFVHELVGLSTRKDGPVAAIDALRQRGIPVVIEKHLPGTHLDGAAMLLDDETPVIGLTLRHDRLDNFWFVLLHEVAHISCHWDRGLQDGFFDDESSAAASEVELEADEYASNALISDELWNASFVRFARSSEQVEAFARKIGVSAAVVAGRIRNERKDFTLFNDLIGSRGVRSLFADNGW